MSRSFYLNMGSNSLTPDRCNQAFESLNICSNEKQLNTVKPV